jgi:hypothetical protein
LTPRPTTKLEEKHLQFLSHSMFEEHNISDTNYLEPSTLKYPNKCVKSECCRFLQLRPIKFHRVSQSVSKAGREKNITGVVTKKCQTDL